MAVADQYAADRISKNLRQQMSISGRILNLDEPHVDHVNMSDLAYGLARTFRYAGHTKGEPYSVAQHSVHVSRLVEEAAPQDFKLQLAGLLHDAAEGPLTDIAYPVKKMISGFVEIEERLLGAICRRAKIEPGLCQHVLIKDADWRSHQLEVRDLLPEPIGMSAEHYWGFDPKTIEGPRLRALQWQGAMELFLARFNHLFSRLLD